MKAELTGRIRQGGQDVSSLQQRVESLTAELMNASNRNRDLESRLEQMANRFDQEQQQHNWQRQNEQQPRQQSYRNPQPQYERQAPPQQQFMAHSPPRRRSPPPRQPQQLPHSPQYMDQSPPRGPAPQQRMRSPPARAPPQQPGATAFSSPNRAAALKSDQRAFGWGQATENWTTSSKKAFTPPPTGAFYEVRLRWCVCLAKV